MGLTPSIVPRSRWYARFGSVGMATVVAVAAVAVLTAGLRASEGAGTSPAAPASPAEVDQQSVSSYCGCHRASSGRNTGLHVRTAGRVRPPLRRRFRRRSSRRTPYTLCQPVCFSQQPLGGRGLSR